jgi:hypothetical protein
VWRRSSEQWRDRAEDRALPALAGPVAAWPGVDAAAAGAAKRSSNCAASWSERTRMSISKKRVRLHASRLQVEAPVVEVVLDPDQEEPAMVEVTELRRRAQPRRPHDADVDPAVPEPLVELTARPAAAGPDP